MIDCAKCGACTSVCPVYQITGMEFLTARGRLHLLARQPVDRRASAAYRDILTKCLLCDACSDVCPRGLDVPAQVAAARQGLSAGLGGTNFLALLTRRLLGRPPLLAGLGRLTHLLPADSGLRLRLGLTTAATAMAAAAAPAVASRPESAGIAYFSGCLARHIEPQIATATAELAAIATGRPVWRPTLQGCCGQATWAAGQTDEARALARRNIAAFADSELPILTSCASCYDQLRRYPDLLADDPAWHERAMAFAARIREFASFFVASPELADVLATASPPSPPLLYHDPCHLRHRHRITAPPRLLLAEVAGFRLRELPHGPQCCGMGGLFHLVHPGLANAIRARLLDDFAVLDAPMVTTTCTGCLIQWRRGLSRRRFRTTAVHPALLLAAKAARVRRPR